MTLFLFTDHGSQAVQQNVNGLVHAGDMGSLQRADTEFNAVYEHLIREALDASLCVEASAATDKESKEMVVHVKSGSEDAWPLALTNEVDLASLLATP